MKRTGQNPDSTGRERRHDERRRGQERRGTLRWDPLRKDRRSGSDRRDARKGADGTSR